MKSSPRFLLVPIAVISIFFRKYLTAGDFAILSFSEYDSTQDYGPGE